jgi:hypothetical protein
MSAQTSTNKDRLLCLLTAGDAKHCMMSDDDWDNVLLMGSSICLKFTKIRKRWKH